MRPGDSQIARGPSAGRALFVLVSFTAPGAATARVRWLLIGAAVAGVAAGAAGVVLQAAIAGGTGVGDALGAVPEVLRTRVGLVWALRTGVFALLAIILVVAGRRVLWTRRWELSAAPRSPVAS